MFGIGIPELVLILIIGLVVFGPGKLPEIGKAVGKSLNEFKKATSSLTAEVEETKTVVQSSVQPPQSPAQQTVVQEPAAVQANATVQPQGTSQPVEPKPLQSTEEKK